MYDINTNNIKKGKKTYFIILGIGILFLIVMLGILMSSYLKAKSLDSKTLSIKVDVNSYYDNDYDNYEQILYSPIYYYIVDGKEYSCKSNSSSSIYPGDDNKTVYYDSNNPSNCMTEYSKSNNTILTAFIILPLILIVIAIININKINKRLKLIKELNQKGKLIKNLPYHLEDTNITVKNVRLQKIVIDYTLSSGQTVKLSSDPRYDNQIVGISGMVDLIIDESNPDNYFIDFEINRLTGNLPSDYSKKNNNQTINSNTSNII